MDPRKEKEERRVGDSEPIAKYCLQRNIYDGFRLPPGFPEESFRSSQKYEPRVGDLIISSFPKTGTTWMQYLTCLIYNSGTPPKGPIMYGTTPFLEVVGSDGVLEYIRPVPIKTHLPFNLTPYAPHAKYIYVYRNPKDTCISYYHHCMTEICPEYKKMTFDEFVEEFITGTTDWNDYWDHVVSWFEQMGKKNILFVSYEEMKRDIRSVILKVADFIGFDISGNKKLLDTIVHESSLPVMKKNINSSMGSLKSGQRPGFVIPEKMSRLMDELNRAHTLDGFSEYEFVRKGLVGDYKNYLNANQEKRINEKTLERFRTVCPQLLTEWRQLL